jgi:hypothetical protein
MKAGKPLIRSDRAGLSSLALGAISILFIGSELEGFDLSLISAGIAILFGLMALDSNKQLSGIMGATLGAFVMFKVFVYNRFLSDPLTEQYELAGLQFNTALFIIIFCIIFSVVFVLLLIPKPGRI